MQKWLIHGLTIFKLWNSELLPGAWLSAYTFYRHYWALDISFLNSETRASSWNVGRISFVPSEVFRKGTIIINFHLSYHFTCTVNYWNYTCPLLTFDPDISGGHDSKDEEKHDEDESLKVVGCHPLHTKQDGSQQFTLTSVEAGTQHVTDAAIIGSPETRCGLLRRIVLDDPRSSTNNMEPWVPAEVQDLFGRGRIERLLHLWDRLPRQ